MLTPWCLSIPNNNPFKMWTLSENSLYIRPLSDQIKLIDNELPDEPYDAQGSHFQLCIGRSYLYGHNKNRFVYQDRVSKWKEYHGIKNRSSVVDIDNPYDLELAKI